MGTITTTHDHGKSTAATLANRTVKPNQTIQRKERKNQSRRKRRRQPTQDPFARVIHPLLLQLSLHWHLSLQFPQCCPSTPSSTVDKGKNTGPLSCAPLPRPVPSYHQSSVAGLPKATRHLWHDRVPLLLSLAHQIRRIETPCLPLTPYPPSHEERPPTQPIGLEPSFHTLRVEIIS